MIYVLGVLFLIFIVFIMSCLKVSSMCEEGVIMRFNKNEYDEIINGEETYKVIAGNLLQGLNVFIGWTDNIYTHYDILFTYKALGTGGYQRGLRTSDLFVSIMSIGSFGFKIDSDKDVGYIAEKLFNGRENESVKAITELINGIIKEMR